METGNPHKDAHWSRWLLLIWGVMSALLIAFRWQNIDFFILADTDDNLRLAQVKAWLGGQAWSDLRQYKLNPPMGADIHWSRIPDLPIAGILHTDCPHYYRGALPGELVRARVVRRKPRFEVAQTLEVLRESSARVVPRCRYFGVCGGCHYQNLTYEKQLQAKTEILRDQLQRIGKIENIKKEDNELVIYPSKEKYDSSKKQPFIAYFDRLKNYLLSGFLEW